MSKDYVTIGEIIKSLEGDDKITRQGLYYYEELGLIAPAIKTERFNLYTLDTIDKVKKIRELSKTYKLEAIKNMIEEGKL
jgi:DNA-binding transcriptional MerR regulator